MANKIFGTPVNSGGTELGAVHIKLPFKSMDDIEFSGTYAPLADKLIETLQEHLKNNSAEDSTDASTDTSEDTSDAK